MSTDLQEIGLTLNPPEPRLDEAVELLARDAGEAVASFLGVSITLVVQSLPVELVAVPEVVEPGKIQSSLQVTLGDYASDGVHGVVTFYAAEAGAFTDLAAVLVEPGAPAIPDLRLDTALKPNLESGVTGYQELTTINRAIGVLISRGNNVQQANDLLLRDATTTRTGLYESARRILENVTENSR